MMACHKTIRKSEDFFWACLIPGFRFSWAGLLSSTDSLLF